MSSEPRTTLPPGAVPVRLRRAPRYRGFVFTGALLGFVAAAALTWGLRSGSSQYSPSAFLGYLGTALALIGGLLGAGVAVLVERPRR